MAEIVLFSDSSCDLFPNIIKEYPINLIPFYVSFESEIYLKANEEISLQEFYKKLRVPHTFPKTSLPSINDYCEHFRPVLAAGNAVICLCLSSKFSGSYAAAVNAKDILLDEFPNAKIEIIDSEAATGQQGLIVLETAMMIKDGLSFEEVARVAKLIRADSRIFFYVDTLEYLEKGGRIGKVSAFLGGMLNIKPVICLKEGELFPIAKVRGKKKAAEKVAASLAEYIAGREDQFNYAIAHADAAEDLRHLEDIILNKLNIPLMYDDMEIGTTIGVYTGPDVCGTACVPKYQQYLKH
ncbi:DegV family protein [Candidatus Epulonipiscium viviparus]|uniref:DegV family protein n=1 Tax=Candidatus Epulonipiscium viviparus TaxID=420336 RepID=UPI00273807A1|nr:DegV family protein [Candidatus Epulopiscium viviparus]